MLKKYGGKIQQVNSKNHIQYISISWITIPIISIIYPIIYYDQWPIYLATKTFWSLVHDYKYVLVPNASAYDVISSDAKQYTNQIHWTFSAILWRKWETMCSMA